MSPFCTISVSASPAASAAAVFPHMLPSAPAASCCGPALVSAFVPPSRPVTVPSARRKRHTHSVAGHVSDFRHGDGTRSTFRVPQLQRRRISRRDLHQLLARKGDRGEKGGSNENDSDGTASGQNMGTNSTSDECKNVDYIFDNDFEDDPCLGDDDMALDDADFFAYDFDDEDEDENFDDFDFDDEDFLLQIGDELLVAVSPSEDGDGEGDGYRSFDDEALLEILGLPDGADSNDLFDLQEMMETVIERSDSVEASPLSLSSSSELGVRTESNIFTPLENALLQGVVPADAGVGSGALPGDFGFDPLGLATKDLFKRTQKFVLSLLPDRGVEDEEVQDIGYDGSALPKRSSIADQDERPPALILRDYREAEIRHGRLAMLAAIIWPLQEILDRLFIPDSFGSTTFVYGGPTLPYLSLLMTFMMLSLGYLDIYAAAIKDADTGEAFLPGECFWDPLSILGGAPDSMKRNMQQRELFNGRIAMLTVACYIFEEALTHKPLITHPINQFLFEPAYQIPAVQAWLDQQFSSPSPTFTFPQSGQVDFVDSLREILDEEAEAAIEKTLQR